MKAIDYLGDGVGSKAQLVELVTILKQSPD